MFSCYICSMENTSDTRIGGYVIRARAHGGWSLLLASTGGWLRTYHDYDRAVSDAERYTRMTAALA